MQNDMRDRLIELLQEYTDNNNGAGSNHGRADYLISNDVVPVVRCSQCKHCRKDIYSEYCDKFSRSFDKFYVEKDHFCSYGERKEDNGKIY